MANTNKLIKVLNRSDGTVTYHLPELNNTRRVFNLGESKDISEKELNALFQMNGGAELIRHFLMVEDREWVKKTFDAPIEYFWGYDEVKKCLLEDDVELFSETLDYAPQGVIDIIKLLSWQLPVKDLNKIHIIMEKLGFDVLGAIEVMKKPSDKPTKETKQGRRRREEA